MTDDTLDELVRWALEHGTLDCQHHWTVTSACPLCLRGRIVRLAEAITALRYRVRELASLPVADEVEAMAQRVDDQAENAEDWASVAESPTKKRWNTAQAAELREAAAMLRSLSRQIAAKDAEIVRLTASSDAWCAAERKL